MLELFSTIFTTGAVDSGATNPSDDSVPPDRQTKNGEFDAGDVLDEYQDEAVDLGERQVTHLESLVSENGSETDATSMGRRHAREGISPDTFARTYEPALRSVIEDVADTHGLSEEATRDLTTGVASVVSDLSEGLEAYETDREHADGFLTIEEVLEAIPQPVYVLDADHRTVGWNYGHTALVGMTREEAIGKHSRESVIKATYSEGSRQLALADKVIEAPRSAEKEYDIDRYETPYCDGHVYYDTSTATNERGEEVELEFWAVPIFDENDELKAVFEILDDRSEEVRRQAGMERLVEEVTDTLDAVGNGNLSARATFEDEYDVVADELLDIVETVNQTTENFQSLVRRVDAKATELDSSVEAAAESARRIETQLDEQNASLEEVVEEMDDFSATMEEIAATSNEVASAADQAMEAAEDGLTSGKDARSVTDEVLETSESLTETVGDLSDRMEEINEVVEVISEVADKTNILALNANIEAARAGKSGDGFSVVANEVKELANETQSHTKEITERIDEIQERSEETVEAVAETHENVQAVDDEIYETVEALYEISDGVEVAATGIADVADANDDQARRVEDVNNLVLDAREDADRVTETAEDIVEETESQEEALGELTESVNKLTSDE